MKRRKISNGEFLLPEPMIQHIQSFLTGKEAARTSVLSKSWYTAWLTRPTLDFDQRVFNDSDVQFPNIGFAEVTTKTMQRYHGSNMKIDSFRLRRTHSSEILTNTLIVSALKRGAAKLDLDASSTAFVMLREVLESEHLVRLSLSRCTIDGNIRCWRLKSLNLHSVHLASDDMIRDILSCCLLLEELSLSFCTRPSNHRHILIDLSGMNMFKLLKLRRLFLEKLWFDPLFFDDFDSRFPCLKDLSVSECSCRWGRAIQNIASTSLESMSFVEVRVSRAKFDVPNLVRFRYLGEEIPSLSIVSSREWESDVSITTTRNARTPWNWWHLRLEKLLKELRLSKISLCISRKGLMKGGKDIRAVSKPVVVENLTIDPPYHSGYTILSGLLRICRPKFLTIYWHPHVSWCPKENNLCKRLTKELITPNCEISDQNMFGQLALKEASMQVLEENLGELTTQEYKRKFRFQLRWG